jgi:LCP family protein required for cell wall assembly
VANPSRPDESKSGHRGVARPVPPITDPAAAGTRTNAASESRAIRPTPNLGPTKAADGPTNIADGPTNVADGPADEPTGDRTDRDERKSGRDTTRGGGGKGPTGPRPASIGPSGKPRRRRSPLWAKLLVTFGSLVLVASLGAIALIKAGVHQIDRAVTQENLLGGAAAAPNPATGKSIDGPINILLVGSDLRPTQTQGGHSDTIIIAHIPASHDRMYLISIPRDLGVHIPAFPPSGYPGGANKINAAYVFGSQNGKGDQGGFQLLAETIKEDYGITFNGGAIVDFSGFTDILTKLGGVSMYVDETTYSIHYGIDIKTGKPAKPYKINPQTGVPYCQPGYSFTSNPLKCALPGTRPNVYPKGYDHLTPRQALDFVRARDGLVGTDYARQRHQQQFIKAVLQEAYSQGLNDPLKLNSFIASIGKALVFDRGGTSLEDWIFTLKGITPASLVAIKTNDGQTVSYDGSAGPIAGSVQGLTADSKALLAAVKADKSATDDNVGLFLQSHQDWAANN